MPSDTTLCKVHVGHKPTDAQHEPRTYGTADEDVVAVWGTPTRSSGNTLVYEWRADSACSKRVTATVELETAHLCRANGQSVEPDRFAASIKVDGLDFQKCWDPYQFNEQPKCPECLDTSTLKECSHG